MVIESDPYIEKERRRLINKLCEHNVQFKGGLPKSRRFCFNCCAPNMFIYSEKVGHSICKICGQGMSMALDNYSALKWFKRGYKKGQADYKVGKHRFNSEGE